MDNTISEQRLQDGKLYRHVNSLIVAHLRDNNLTQAASAVASATMTPLNVEAPPNKLLELVAKVFCLLLHLTDFLPVVCGRRSY